MLTNALPILVSMAAAKTELISSFAIASQVMVENDVRWRLTSAGQIPVNMVAFAVTFSMPTLARACLDTLEKIVRPTLMTA